MNSDRPRRVPRFFSCLVKGPLGCLAFVAGAALVVVLLLPPALGRVLDRALEDWFSERHAGELELGDAWLGSLYGEQRVERLILRDPGGEEVLRGELTAPALSEAFDGPLHRYGPVRLRIELLRVVENESGTTNLERAFAELPREPEELARPSGLTTDLPIEIELELRIARLRYSSGNGKESLLENLLLRGTLQWGPDATRLVLEGGAEPTPKGERGDEKGPGNEPLHARIECERPEFGSHRPWKIALALEGAPTVLARALCPALRPLARRAGARIDHLQWSRDEREVALSCADEGTSLELAGEETDGLVSGPSGSRLTAALACASLRGQTLVAALLPLLDRLDCEYGSALHELHLYDFRWPLDGDWSRLGGELELVLAPGRGTLVPLGSLARGEPLVALLGPLQPRLPVRDGVLEYAGLQLPLEEGWLVLDGSLELARGVSALEVTGESRGAILEGVRLVGQGGAPARFVPDPPAVPVVQDGAVPLPPGESR